MAGGPSAVPVPALALSVLALGAVVAAGEPPAAAPSVADGPNAGGRSRKMRHLRDRAGRLAEGEPERTGRRGAPQLGAAPLDRGESSAADGGGSPSAPASAAQSWPFDWIWHVEEMKMGFDAGDCARRRWRPDPAPAPDGAVACTNALLDGSHSAEAGESFISWGECCDTLLVGATAGEEGGPGHDRRCVAHDDCGDLAAAAAAARPSRRGRTRSLSCSGNLGFHPDTNSEDGCTNDLNYPPPWTRPGLKEKMFHPTAEKCCEYFFRGDSDCPVTYVCGGGGSTPTPPKPSPKTPSSPSASECKWHIELSKQEGCTDDRNYPEVWLKNPDTMFYDTAGACCAMMFPNKPCKKIAVGCAPPTPRPTPTPPPTPPVPTKMPTRQPITPKPTKRPTRRPTFSPTKTPLVYYVTDGSGMCVSNYEVAKPEWIKDVFPVYDMCCLHARDIDRCRAARPKTSPDGMPLGTPRPTPTPPTMYYADPLTGVCVDHVEKPMQSWMKASLYVDYRRCCAMDSTDFAKCLLMDPGMDGLVSSYPTQMPPPLWYLKDSDALCYNQWEHAMPYDVRTFDEYSECCEKSWDKEKCLQLQPTPMPTTMPTLMPSTPYPTDFATCPKKYDTSAVYGKGDEVESGTVIYKCKRHAVYCNKPEFRPPLEDPGPEVETKAINSVGGGIPVINAIPISGGYGTGGVQEKEDNLWSDAWERVVRCAYAPSASPSSSPSTPAPTCRTKWHPGDMRRKVCTNKDNDYPLIWNLEPLLSNYFVDTAEECCDKFFRGKKCRVKDFCSS